MNPHHPARLALALCVGLLALQLTGAAAQTDPATPLTLPRPGTTLHFTHLTSDDGLAQNNVEDIVQDQQGFMWIGTASGLSRFDGYTFTTYRNDPTDPTSLSSNWVRDLYVDPAGTLWVGTEGGGVNQFDPQTETFIRYFPDPQNPDTRARDRIFKIFGDSAGNLWFLGGGRTGLNRFNPTTRAYAHYPTDIQGPTAFQGTAVWDVVEDQPGSLWMAASTLLAHYDLQTEHFTYYPPAEDDTRLNVIHRDSAGRLWLGGTAGLYHFDPQLETLVLQPGPRGVNSIVEDAGGNLWLATGSGLAIFDPRAGQFIRHFQTDATQTDSLNSNSLTVLYRDQAGLVWIGTGDSGLNLYKPRQAHFAHYRHSPSVATSLAPGSVSAIYAPEAGWAWVGTGSTLNQVNFTTGEVRAYTTDTLRGAIRAVFQDRAGLVWVASSGFQLHTFDPGTGQFTPYPLESALSRPTPPKGIVDFYEDAAGNLWMAVNHDGLYRLDSARETVQFFEGPTSVLAPGTEPPANPIHPPINDVYADRMGNLWVSTLNGLSRFDPNTGRYQPFRAKPGAGADSFMEAVVEAADGVIWVASQDGLIRLDPATGTTRYYTEKDGLPGVWVVGVVTDAAGNLWLSTKKGLARFVPATETFHTYDRTDGLQGSEFNAQAFKQTPDGQLLAGGTGGLTAFYPEQIEVDDYQPAVILTEFQLAGETITPGAGSVLERPIQATERLTLKYDQNFLAFKFAALSYADPDHNHYRYQLEGFDPKWIDATGEERHVTYTNLPPGHYVFRVQGSNDDGVWSERAVALAITVQPPWWATWWFQTAAALVLAGALVGGVRWRLYAIEQRNRTLERQVTERTAELRDSEMQLRLAKEAADDARQAAEAANRAKSAFLANMSHELRSPLNAILGFAQIIDRQDHLLPESHENLGIIIRSGEHLLTLINQVLDLSKIEAGRITLNPSAFDLSQLLDDLENMLTLRAEEKNLRLLIERAPDLPRFIHTDEIKLRQVLINLLTNAIKFTHEGGVILRLRPLPTAPASLSLPLQFEIEDTGPGIAAHEMDLLFEAFAQTSAGRQAQEGTGLGLPISRKFVELMGGTLAVKSEVGRGTVFTFTIQCQAAEAASEHHFSPRQRVIGLEAGQPPYRILVVDDNWTNRQLLVKLLAPLGFDVREAENGQHALQVWETFNPQLIWMDMRMPVMDGFEATQRIKATTQGQATAIIALTASSFEEERAIVISAGCDDFVRKPFREDEIFEMMTKHIGARFVFEQAALPETPPNGAAPFAADLKHLHPELRVRLREGVELGDLELIDAALNAIRPHWPATAEALDQLAHQFDYDRLLHLLQEADG